MGDFVPSAVGKEELVCWGILCQFMGVEDDCGLRVVDYKRSFFRIAEVEAGSRTVHRLPKSVQIVFD